MQETAHARESFLEGRAQGSCEPVYAKLAETFKPSRTLLRRKRQELRIEAIIHQERPGERDSCRGGSGNRPRPANLFRIGRARWLTLGALYDHSESMQSLSAWRILPVGRLIAHRVIAKDRCTSGIASPPWGCGAGASTSNATTPART